MNETVESEIHYLMEHEDHEAHVEECECDNYALIALVWVEHFVQEWIEVAERAHEECCCCHSSQSIRSL